MKREERKDKERRCGKEERWRLEECEWEVALRRK
jgi:hypothetical protein